MLCLRIPMLLPSLDCVTASEQASCTVFGGCEYFKMGCSAASMLSEKLSSQQGVLKTEMTHKSCFFFELPPAPSKRWCQKTGMQVLFCKSWTVMTLPLEVATLGMQNPTNENSLIEDNLRLTRVICPRECKALSYKLSLVYRREGNMTTPSISMREKP